MVTTTGNVAEFRFFRPNARGVWLVGDFNNWQPGENPMMCTPEGYWVARLTLPEGLFKFRYFADGEWFIDYAAFGIEYGPFGPDSIMRMDGRDQHGQIKAHSRPAKTRRAQKDQSLRVA